jgi:hypothetical protein
MNRTIFSQSTAATFEIAAAKTGFRIQLLGFVLSSAGVTVATFKSATTAITGPFQFVAGSCVPVPPQSPLDPVVMAETTSGEALNLTLSLAVAVGGQVWYDYVM